MFANILVDQEKEAFIKLLIYLSYIDGELTEEEKLFIQQSCIELDINPTSLFQQKEEIILNITDILQEFQRPIAKNTVILELVNLAYTDKSYTIEEQRGIRHIAEILALSEDKILRIEAWVKEGIQWADKGLTLITNEERG